MIRAICILVYVLASVCAIGCVRGHTPDSSLFWPRGGWPKPTRQVLITIDGEYPRVAPYEFRVLIHVNAGEYDYRMGKQDKLAVKCEMNFDDGTVWLDFTTEVLAYIRGGEQDPELLPVHVFENPGTYKVQARVTYWDEEVLYSSPNFTPLVILPPDSGTGG